MWDKEKLGFTFEVAPYDFSALNRFFGTTTDWVDEGSSATIPWNGNSSQEPINPLDEETAQQIYKAFEDIRKTMGKGFPMVFTKRKARKHYKPKFTL